MGNRKIQYTFWSTVYSPIDISKQKAFAELGQDVLNGSSAKLGHTP